MVTELIDYVGYPFLHDDGGRSMSSRPKQRNDCTVRALAIVVDRPYDAVYNLLKTYGRGCSDGFEIREFLDKYKVYGNRFVWKPFQAVKGQRRMNPVTFCQQFQTGRYITYTAKHVSAVINGVWHDTFSSHVDRCIYGVHEVIQEK